MDGDIFLVEKFVDLGERIFEGFKYKWFGEELRENLPKELDFASEVRNAKKTQKLLKNIKNVKVPHIYDSLSNVRV